MSDITIKLQWRMIHKAIHDKRVKKLRLGRTDYPVQLHENGCRFMDYDNIRFVQQNPKAKSTLGRRARRGEQITWANPFGTEEKGFVIDQTLLMQPVVNASIALPQLLNRKEAKHGSTAAAEYRPEESQASAGSEGVG